MDKNGLIHVDILDGLGVSVEPSYFEVDRVGVQPDSLGDSNGKLGELSEI